MVIVLSDHDGEGQARRIFEALQRTGLADLAGLELRLFEDVGLDPSASDERVWRFCQAQGYLLLTGNRTAVGGCIPGADDRSPGQAGWLASADDQ